MHPNREFSANSDARTGVSLCVVEFRQFLRVQIIASIIASLLAIDGSKFFVRLLELRQHGYVTVISKKNLRCIFSSFGKILGNIGKIGR